MQVLNSPVVKGVQGASLVALLGGACLDPLPSPTKCEDPDGYVVGDECRSCPPSAQIPAESCVTAVLEAGSNAIAPFCLAEDPTTRRCLLGSEEPSACDPTAEPPDLPACYTDVCPSVVTDRVPGAICIDPVGEPTWTDFENGDTPECRCRSFAEMQRCDGRGVVFAAFNAASFGDPVDHRADGFTIGLPQGLADAGEIGLFVRLRGYAQPMFTAFSRWTSEPYLRPTPESYFNVTYFSAIEFTDVLVFGESSDGINVGFDGELTNDPAGWTTLGEHPVVFGVGVSAEPAFETIEELENGPRRFYYLEIDCVIPFYVPD
jgi:hypothetical protein